MSSVKRKKELNDWFKDYKKKTGCQICGYKEHPEILIVHHKELIRRKKGETGHRDKIAGRGESISLMKKRLKKCLILCPNCHYWLHYEDNKLNFS